MQTKIGDVISDFNNEIFIEREKIARLKQCNDDFIWNPYGEAAEWCNLKSYSKAMETKSCLFRSKDNYKMESHIHRNSYERVTVETEACELILFLITGEQISMKYNDTFVIPKGVFHILWIKTAGTLKLDFDNGIDLINHFK